MGLKLLLDTGVLLLVLMASCTPKLSDRPLTETRLVPTTSSEPLSYLDFEGVQPLKDKLSDKSIVFTGTYTPQFVTNPIGQSLKLDFQTPQFSHALPKSLSGSYAIEFTLKFGPDAFRHSINFPQPRYMRILMVNTNATSGNPIALEIGVTSGIRAYQYVQDPTDVTKTLTNSINSSDDINLPFTGTGPYNLASYLDGKPHHFVLQRDADRGSFELWIDGQGFSVNSKPGKLAYGGLSKPVFGAANNPRDLFSGELDELAVHGNTLHPSLIVAHSNQVKSNQKYVSSAPIDPTPPLPSSPTTSPVTTAFETKDFLPGTQLPTKTDQTIGEVPDPLTQFKNSPAPRYQAIARPAPKLVNWMDPGYQAGRGQGALWGFAPGWFDDFYNKAKQMNPTAPENASHDKFWYKTSADIQLELAQNWNYGLVFAVQNASCIRGSPNCGWPGAGNDLPLPGDPSEPVFISTDVGTGLTKSTLDLMKANPTLPRHVITFSSLIHDGSWGGPGSSAEVSGQTQYCSGAGVSSCKFMSIATSSGNEERTYWNGRLMGWKLRSYIKYLSETNNGGRSASNAFDLVSENGEFGNFYLGWELLGRDPAIRADEKAFSGSTQELPFDVTENAINGSTARITRYTNKRYADLSIKLREGLRYQSGLSNILFSLYQISGLAGVGYDSLRDINSPITGAENGCFPKAPKTTCNLPTADLYTRYPWNINRVSAWNGLGFFEDVKRAEEQTYGDRLMTPFVGAGWAYRTEEDVRPTQWLMTLKAMLALGSISFKTGYFSLGDTVNGKVLFQDARFWAWQALVPAYAQALLTQGNGTQGYVIDYLRNGDLVTREKQITSEQDNWKLWTGDPRDVVFARRLSGSPQKYLIIGGTQRFSNQAGDLPDSKNVTVKLNGTPLTFAIRPQGSVYLVDLNQANPLVSQPDSWHEGGVASRWSKTVVMESELPSSSSGIAFRTDLKGPHDFTWFRTTVSFPRNRPSDFLSHDFQPRSFEAAAWSLELTPGPMAHRNAQVRVELYPMKDAAPAGKPLLSEIISLNHPRIEKLPLKSHENYRLVIRPITRGVVLDRTIISPVMPERITQR